MTVSIHSPGPEHNDAVAEVLARAFGGSDEARLVASLRAAGVPMLERIALRGGAVLGHVALSAMQSPLKTAGLAPVAVHPDWQGQGIGTAMVRDVLSAGAEQWLAAFVLGEPGYYRRFGFETGAATGFESRYPASHMMALALRPEGLAGLTGQLRYAAPIEALGEAETP